MRLRIFYRGLFVLLFGACAVLGDDRQLIWVGWDMPTPARFEADVADFEKLKIFDGSGIYPTRKLQNGTIAHASDVSTNEHWAWSEFEQALADLQKAKPTLCTNNFLSITANPGSVDWFDDQGWNEIVDHWRLLARLAQKSGLSGLLFDPEPYHLPWAQFLYTAQPSHTAHSFAEMQTKARERGRAVMQAVVQEYPGITIFAYRLFCDLLRADGHAKPGANLQADRFGLFPAFVDGWCDAMPPTVTLIDGNENAFTYTKTDRYAATFARIKRGAPNFVSPQNRAKIQRQLLVGHGIYLDAVVAGSPITIDLKGMPPAAHLLTFTSAAIDAADGLVWVYGEKGRFWSTRNSSAAPWTDKIPGIASALRAAKDPNEFAREYIASSNAKNNVLRGAEFAAGVWQNWQAKGSKGVSSRESGSAILSQMQYGTVGQSVTVTPGETYVVGVKVKQSGQGAAGLLINWKGGGKFVAQSEIVELIATDSPAADGWRQIAGLVTVPSEANELAFLCFARGQESDKSTAIFKDPVVVRASQ